MKIIIAYASAGAGHRKAAEALYNYFRDKSTSDDLKLVDALEKSTVPFRYIYACGYHFLVNYAAWLWAALFWLTSFRLINFIFSPLVFVIDRLNNRKLSEFLIREQADVIISTHFLPPEIAAYLKRKRLINSKLVTVITDFGVHPFWIVNGTDTYVAASSFTRKALLNAGINENSILELGIPVNSGFSLKYDRKTLCSKLKIMCDKLTVLITTGSFAIGPVEKIVESLYKYVQIMVVCANNKKLYNSLKRKNYPDVSVFGFIDNIQELMAASDIVIAKPGGLTTSEILTMELVPIFISPIPGQETVNMKIMEALGIGKFAPKVRDIKKLVLEYKQDRDKLVEIKNRIKKIKKTNASGDIYNALR